MDIFDKLRSEPIQESMKQRFKKNNPYPFHVEDMHFKDDRSDFSESKREMKWKKHNGHKPKWRAVRRENKRFTQKNRLA